MSFDESSGRAYEKVNEIFAESVAPHVQDGDLIWVHDYHLMLLPLLLRRQLGDSRKNAKIAFFLHTPFPALEFFTILPGRKRVLEGLLNCDLTGFHTEEYSRHFIETCEKVMTHDGVIEYNGRKGRTGAFPIGIEPDDFRETLRSEKTQRTLEELRKQFKDIKVMVSVDRMDYTKGVPQKLHALDRFFTTHPEWAGNTLLIQVAVPSRDDAEEHQKLRNEVNGLVGKLAGKYGTPSWSPIHFMHKSVSKDELVALYALSDVCLVSSRHDRMNLVSYEYADGGRTRSTKNQTEDVQGVRRL